MKANNCLVKTIVILAAGRGSRFGGTKQFARFGQYQKTLMEYNLCHAFDAGFERVVFITQAALYHQLTDEIIARLPKFVTAEVVFQDNQNLPMECIVDKQRTKPLGTAHALWCAKDHLTEPFVVINADDYYGPQAFHLIQQHMTTEKACLIAYQVEQTLSDHGGVNRGICQLSPTGYLTSIEEITEIHSIKAVSPTAKHLYGTNPKEKRITIKPGTLVSMNFWCFNPFIFSAIEQALKTTFSSKSELETECYLPDAVINMTIDSSLPIKVLSSQDTWFGVTYAADSEFVDKKISQLINEGVFSSLVS